MKPRGFLMDCALIKLHTGNPIRFKFFYRGKLRIYEVYDFECPVILY